MFLHLAFRSLLSRKGSVILTFVAILVSILVLLGIEHIRQEARNSFSNTISGTDLIVGARTGDLNLLLYSVFRLGNATNNLDWSTYQTFRRHKDVAWTIPISLGDSHKGYRVLGTNGDYFTHFRYGQKHPLTFATGQAFNDLYDVVLGAEVARALNYQTADQLVLAHGMAATSFSVHDDKPFTVSGILNPTGTPVDQTVHVSLEAISAIHLGWQNGVRLPGMTPAADQIAEDALTPDSITAFLVGLKSRMATFRFQREINTYRPEALTAILPGVTLTELWQTMAILENTLRLVALLVLLSALLGLSATLLTSVRERRREIAILRTLGASPVFIFLLIQAEALLITLSAAVTAVLLLSGLLFASSDYLASQFGIFPSLNILSEQTLWLLGIILSGALLVSTIPALSAYRSAMNKELS